MKMAKRFAVKSMSLSLYKIYKKSALNLDTQVR